MNTLIHQHKIDAFNRDLIVIERVTGLGDPCIEGKVYRIGMRPSNPPSVAVSIATIPLDRERAKHTLFALLDSDIDPEDRLTALTGVMTQFRLAGEKTLRFQDGPVSTSGVNGITNEALLAIVIDRLECFQRGAYRCRENALALTKLEEALHWLRHRAADRERRGVEGKNEP